MAKRVNCISNLSNLRRKRRLEALYSSDTCFQNIFYADEGYQLFAYISKHVYQDTLISMIFWQAHWDGEISISIDLSVDIPQCMRFFFQKRAFIDSVDPQRNTPSTPRPNSATEKVWKCLPILLTGIFIRLILTFKSNNLDMITLNLELSKSSKILFVVKQFC